MNTEKFDLDQWVEALDSALEKLDMDDAMETGGIDGFLAGLLTLPTPPHFEEFLPYIFSESGDPMAIPAHSDELIALIKRRYEVLDIAYRAREAFDPVILPFTDDDGEVDTSPDLVPETLAPWIWGFVQAVHTFSDPDQWSQEASEAFLPIGLYAMMATDEEENESEGSGQNDDIDFVNEFRKNGFPYEDNDLIEAISTVVNSALALRQIHHPNVPITVSEKIGRNDPCPCGSGKKYKQCCGKK